MLRRLLLVLVSITLGLAAASPAAADVTKVECTGEATIESIGNFEIREVGGVTMTSFDFTGSHPFCDRNGNPVAGSWSGHLVQRVAPNGTTTLHVQATDAFLGGTLEVIAQVTIANGTWISSAHAGNGTGGLEGVTTHQVEIFPTGDPFRLGFRTTIFWP